MFLLTRKSFIYIFSMLSWLVCYPFQFVCFYSFLSTWTFIIFDMFVTVLSFVFLFCSGFFLAHVNMLICLSVIERWRQSRSFAIKCFLYSYSLSLLLYLSLSLSFSPSRALSHTHAHLGQTLNKHIFCANVNFNIANGIECLSWYVKKFPTKMSD